MKALPGELPAAALQSPPPGHFLGSVCSHGLASFRVWAPTAERVHLIIEGRSSPRVLRAEGEGYFRGDFADLRPGTLYQYCLDDRGPFPDPCSRYQPSGPHGPSMLVDAAYDWQDQAWRGLSLPGQVIYELHIGTFTPEGTLDAAAQRLPYLRDLGITVIELMPLAECPGRWNWGYDGVQLYAPYHVYGDYASAKRFVDRAHALGIGVILDVVYNHLGPDGNYLRLYSPHYFSKAYRTEWGEALNFDGEHSRPVRDFVIDNACYWIQEFHMDGLRLDATQCIFDSSRPHILAELSQRARQAAPTRQLILTAENEAQRSEHLAPLEAGGYALDGMWNDDFHHSARVALTGRRDGYFKDYRGRAQELLSSIRHGFLYQGQYYSWQKQPRGTALRGQPAWSCVHFLQNHDQVANTFIGDRLHMLTSPARYRAMTALLLLGPQTPLLFMGQEFAASTRFAFFADHELALARLVHQGRRGFLSQFSAYATEAAQRCVRDPAAKSTFHDSKLDWDEAADGNPALALHRDLLRLRREDPLISRQRREEIEGAVLSENALVLRWLDSQHGDDRLLVVNLGPELDFCPAPEPLLAPPPHTQWQMCWSSEAPEYGGSGAISPVDHRGNPGWQIPAECAVLLNATPTRPAVMSHD